MSVHKRMFRAYSGPRTPERWRFLVLTRYAMADVWASRVTNVLFVLCMVPTLVSLVFIYIMNSDTARLLIGEAIRRVPVDQYFFFRILAAQCWLALVLTAWIGPRVIAPDLSNDALALLLSRPISRTQYVLGKLVVLWTYLSLATWVPVLLLFWFQAHMAAEQWLQENLFIAWGMLIGSVIWILVLSMLALALASWVKWRIVATGLIFGAIFVAAGMGTVFNGVMRTSWGQMVNVPAMMTLLWQRLLHVDPRFNFGYRDVPSAAIALSLFTIVLLCMAALNARIRAREVVRG